MLISYAHLTTGIPIKINVSFFAAQKFALITYVIAGQECGILGTFPDGVIPDDTNDKACSQSTVLNAVRQMGTADRVDCGIFFILVCCFGTSRVPLCNFYSAFDFSPVNLFHVIQNLFHALSNSYGKQKDNPTCDVKCDTDMGFAPAQGTYSCSSLSATPTLNDPELCKGEWKCISSLQACVACVPCAPQTVF